MSNLSIPIWKEAPFIRLLIPFIAGIMVEWYVGLPLRIYELTASICLILIILFSFLKSFTRFKNYWLAGILINALFITVGGAVTYLNDIRHNTNCITNLQHNDNTYAVTLLEPLSEKENSFKANASLNQLFYNGTMTTAQGNIIIYFQKDSSLKNLDYNSHICFRKKLQPIKNSGNPGAFDYHRYCIFQKIYYQVYLKPSDYLVLQGGNDHTFNKMLFTIRERIVIILQTFITGEKEAGLAEALLIGYKDDLDKNLVQSYSNTGVVHIIAISGLHLGLIYWLLNLLLHPFKLNRRLRWINALLVISGLWLFSILTGGAASVCRSALMFSFIVTGENIGRRTNIYNSMAASAFLLLCYNPYWLWDAGFQLSYIAVLSIIIFMKPVYNWFYIKNKLLDHIWKLAAISIAAQILTTPVSIFHFQQFPNYFLITNVVAVPLSSLVVLAELALCAVSFISFLASPLGGFTCWLIKIMNAFIDYINSMPFTTTNGLHLSLTQLVLFYLIIIVASCWIFKKNKTAFIFSLSLTCCCCILRSYSIIESSFQQHLIVYNAPHLQAIDLINGGECLFIGDSMSFNNPSLQKFILQPSRNEYRIKHTRHFIPEAKIIPEFVIAGKHILVIDSSVTDESLFDYCSAEVVILSGDPRITIIDLQKITNFKKVIFDSSNSALNISKWKAACRKANIAFYSVAENGAFILNLN